MEKYSFTAGGGAQKARLTLKKLAWGGYWQGHFQQRLLNQLRTPAA